MSSSIKIIVISPSRWEEYKTLRLESLKEDPQSFGQTYEKVSNDLDDKWKTVLIQAEKEEKDILYFAEDQGKLIGIMGAFFQKNPDTQDSGMIYGAYVNKQYRGQGVGKQLLAKVIERLSAQPGVNKAKLSVSATEEPAQRLYENLGFKVVSETNAVLGDGKNHKLFLMEKEL